MTIQRVLLESGSRRVASILGRMLPVEARAPLAHERVITLDDTPLDWWAFDRAVDRAAAEGPFALRLLGRGAKLARTARHVLTHLQRLCPRRNAASAGFDEVLRRHRALHDLDKPLVRADFDHAIDAWQWSLRLSPEASAAAQIAALFHDVERLQSEADARIEQFAGDYQAFKDAHAHVGAALTRRALEGAVEPEVLERAALLVATHERPDPDPERTLLNDADALSFFSLNVDGFLRYYGEAHTRKKLAWSRARLSPRGLRLLARLPLRADLRAMLEEVS